MQLSWLAEEYLAESDAVLGDAHLLYNMSLKSFTALNALYVFGVIASLSFVYKYISIY